MGFSQYRIILRTRHSFSSFWGEKWESVGTSRSRTRYPPVKRTLPGAEQATGILLSLLMIHTSDQLMQFDQAFPIRPKLDRPSIPKSRGSGGLSVARDGDTGEIGVFPLGTVFALSDIARYCYFCLLISCREIFLNFSCPSHRLTPFRTLFLIPPTTTCQRPISSGHLSHHCVRSPADSAWPSLAFHCASSAPYPRIVQSMISTSPVTR